MTASDVNLTQPEMFFVSPLLNVAAHPYCWCWVFHLPFNYLHHFICVEREQTWTILPICWDFLAPCIAPFYSCGPWLQFPIRVWHKLLPRHLASVPPRAVLLKPSLGKDYFVFLSWIDSFSKIQLKRKLSCQQNYHIIGYHSKVKLQCNF